MQIVAGAILLGLFALFGAFVFDWLSFEVQLWRDMRRIKRGCREHPCVWCGSDYLHEDDCQTGRAGRVVWMPPDLEKEKR